MYTPNASKLLILRSGTGLGLAPASSSALADSLQHGTSFAAAPALQTASFTVAAVGGGAAAAFGPPGVAGAPVITTAISPGVLILGALALAAGIYFVTR